MLQDTSKLIAEHAEPTVAEADQKSGGVLARECLEAADGDWKEAALLMRALIDEDHALKAALVEPLIDGAIWYQIRKAAERLRRPWPEKANKDQSEGLGYIATERARSIYDWPLPGGKRLGDAGKEELIEAVEFYTMQASGMTRRAKFLQIVLEKMGKAKKVRDKLSEDEIRSLMEQAK